MFKFSIRKINASNRFEQSSGKKPKDPPNNKSIQQQRHIPKFQVRGLKVPEKRSLYSKGYTTFCNIENFKLQKNNNTSSVAYTFEDESTEQIEGKH